LRGRRVRGENDIHSYADDGRDHDKSICTAQ
jgi:hypothetical protein